MEYADDEDIDIEYEATLERMCTEWEQRVRGQGREQGTRANISDLYETRFGSMPEDLRAAIARIRGEDTLRRILIVTGTRGAEDVSEAVREARGAS